MSRSYDPIDRLVAALDQAMRTVFVRHHGARPMPTARTTPKHDQLTTAERRLSASLMRVNHAGEVCAQALYQAQSLTARTPRVRAAMEHAAQEENDHLDWCEQRIEALAERTSLLNPLWYAGSFAIGMAAGLTGDKWNLAFLAETERQVVRHLEGHLERLPENDVESRAVVKQMHDDEANHAATAVDSGAAELPAPIKKLMGMAAAVMTTAAARI